MTGLFLVIFGYAVGERIGELFLSRRNRAVMRSRGFAQREPLRSLALMAGMHTLWLASSLAEATLAPMELPIWVAIAAAVLFAAAQALRFWTLRTLGSHWNVSVMTGAQGASTFVSNGPYRYIRHPNYLVVILEIVSLPLIGGAVVAATLFSVLNAIVLFSRIKIEEQHLRAVPGYWDTMQSKPRFIPGLG